jgi:two-component system chemotaxis response regulator CheB
MSKQNEGVMPNLKERRIMVRPAVAIHNHIITVLVVEDSPLHCELLTHILNSDPEIQVVGSACNGVEALEAVQKYRPCVVTMDIVMPVMDGIEATRCIMETQPVPIVIVSALLGTQETEKTRQALAAGAVATIEKPPGPAHVNHVRHAKQLVRLVKTMSEIKTVRRWSSKCGQSPLPGAPTTSVFDNTPSDLPAEGRAGQNAGATFEAATGQQVRELQQNALPNAPAQLRVGELRPLDLKLIVMGASTGGPPVLRTILAQVAPHLSVPVLVVQHISPGFLDGLRHWLQETTGLPTLIATDGIKALPGHVYLAPDEQHMGITSGGRIVLSTASAESGLCPSVAHLFDSVAQTCPRTTAGILLTGMGRDGAEQLKQMRDKGALTIAQDKDSSVVHGMPGEAIRIKGCDYALPPPAIAEMLKNFLRRQNQQ